MYGPNAGGNGAPSGGESGETDCTFPVLDGRHPVRIYNKWGAGEAENSRERMQDLVVRVQRVVAEVVAEECVS